MNRVCLELPSVAGGWSCITSDNPWRFNDRGSRLAPDQRRKRWGRKGYRTLQLQQLLELPVDQVAAPDAFLFLWAPDCFIADGTVQQVARAWGFEPKRTWTWRKASPPLVDSAWLVEWLAAYAGSRLVGDPGRHAAELRRLLRCAEGVRRHPEQLLPRLAFGGGHYVRTATEKVLICRRGRARFLVHNVRDIFDARPARNPVTGEVHSTKPARFLELVEQVCPGPRLELFARSSRPGWTSWGDQVEQAGRAVS